ncbi:extracellular solute-binding protein [Caminicella sporogenes]|uniref:extracellular solute-binding protein n=1 Tax=Caminicella sporogenes TaxID=166485 RepID=UPI00253FC84B|nr:extracellular solute-binding protein [Caminicella sporogenes]WIF95245.1 extracellular solute-binding protein [Caminicella sporogenes]
MKVKKYGPFTLFLCLVLIVFILFAPYFFMKPKLDKIIDKAFKRNIEWRGIITIWDYPRLDITTGYKYSWLRSKIKEFERKNPGVIIQFKPLDLDYGYIEIETAIKTNSYPDIAPVGADFEIISKGMLEPLDDFLTQDEIESYKFKAISAVKYKNKIWGLPYCMENYSLFLNLDLFNKQNVKPPKNGNWTYEEFVEILKKLTSLKSKKGRKNIYGFNSYIKPNDYTIWGIILSDGATVIERKSNKYKFYGKNAWSGLKKLVDLKLVHKVTPKDFGENNSKEAWRSFIVDKNVAVYPGRTSLINELKILNSRGKGFNFDVENFPIGLLKKPMSVSIVNAYGIFKQNDKKKLEMCVKFIKYLTDEEGQRELYKQGVFPVKKNIGDIYINDEMMKKIEKTLSNSISIGNHPKWRKIDDILQSQIRMALLGKKSVDEALEDARKKIEQIE